MEAIIDILLGRVGEPYRQYYHEEQVKTNISRMFGLSIYMLLIQIVLNAINIMKPAGTKDSSIMLFVGLSMAAMGSGLFFLVLSVLCRRGKIRNPRVLWFLPYLLMYLYGIIQMAFFSLNIQAETGGVNSYVIAVILLSFCLVIRPIHNIINVLFCLGYTFTVMFMTRGRNSTWNSVMITDAWANLIIITILVLVMSTLSYSMYRSDFINRMKLERSVRHAEKLARIDTLTGALNRRGFFERLDEHWPELQAQNKNVAVTMLDIDYFKEFNDQHGHLAGDNCLYEVATALRDYFERQGGWFCRFGGEEFLAVFFPDSPESVRTVIEGARTAVEAVVVAGIPGQYPQITISAGYDTGRAPGLQYERLINQADIALYHSKRSGRNMVSEYRETKGEKSQHARGSAEPEKLGYTGIEKRAGRSQG